MKMWCRYLHMRPFWGFGNSFSALTNVDVDHWYRLYNNLQAYLNIYEWTFRCLRYATYSISNAERLICLGFYLAQYTSVQYSRVDRSGGRRGVRFLTKRRRAHEPYEGGGLSVKISHRLTLGRSKAVYEPWGRRGQENLFLWGGGG